MNLLNYLKEKGLRRSLQVLWQYKLDNLVRKAVLLVEGRRPLLNAIVIESHNDFDCNGGAFYDYLLENGYLDRYRVIWLVKNRKAASLPAGVSCFRLHGPSFRKAHYLCRAKYLCFDNEIFAKLRPDQICVFCDHGAVALKSIRDTYKIPKDVDIVLSPSENYAPVLAREYSLEDGLSKFRHIGYPCHDVFYRECENELLKLTDRRYDKVFLWMPTFRKGGGYRRDDGNEEQPFGLPLLQTQQEFDALQQFLALHNSLLIIKIHPMQDPSTLSALKETENIRVLTGSSVKQLHIDNYRLVKCADALISDYSGIAFSYLLLDRPLGFVLSDMGAYKRGFAMDNPEDYLVGQKIMHFDDFYAFLESVLDGKDTWQDARQQLTRWLYTERNGNSCYRLAEILGLEK